METENEMFLNVKRCSSFRSIDKLIELDLCETEQSEEHNVRSSLFGLFYRNWVIRMNLVCMYFTALMDFYVFFKIYDF